MRSVLANSWRRVVVAAVLVGSAGFGRALDREDLDAPVSPTMAALRRQIAAGDRVAAVRFWEQIRRRGTPLLEQMAGRSPDRIAVTFLWHGDRQTRNVVVFLQPGGANPADWTRRDPDIASLHGDPEFEKLYPATKAGT